MLCGVTLMCISFLPMLMFLSKKQLAAGLDDHCRSLPTGTIPFFKKKIKKNPCV